MFETVSGINGDAKFAFAALLTELLSQRLLLQLHNSNMLQLSEVKIAICKQSVCIDATIGGLRLATILINDSSAIY